MPPNERDKTDNVARAMAKGSLYIFVGNTVSTALMALASIQYARFLGPDGYGVYGLALVLPFLLAGFTDLGTNAALSKLLPTLRRENVSSSGLIRSGLLFNIAISAALFSLLFALPGPFARVLLNRGDIEAYVRMASFFIIFQVITSTANSIFVGMDETKYSAIVSVVQASVKFTLAVLLVPSFGVSGTIAGTVLSLASGGILALVFCIRLYRDHREDGEGGGIRVDIRSMLSYGLPIYSTIFITGAIARYQQMVLAWFTTNAELGNYYVAVNFMSLMTIVSLPLGTMLLPSFSKLEGEPGQLRGFLGYSVKYTLYVVAPISFLISSVSGDLVRLFYGPEFSLAPSYLAVYALAFSCSAFALVLGNFFKGTGRVRVFLYATLVGFAASLPLTFLMVSRWKVIWLAYALFIVDIITFAYLYREARAKHGIRIGVGDPVRIFLAAILSFAVAYIFKTLFQMDPAILSLVVNGVIFLLSYLVASTLMGVMRREDLDNLRLAFRETPFTPIIDKLLALYEGITSSLGILK
jgi:O-antigen/teichoic acid export membrane protein